MFQATTTRRLCLMKTRRKSQECADLSPKLNVKMVMEDYQEFCRRCMYKVNMEIPCNADSNHRGASSAIHFHGRPVLQPMLSEEQRIEMAKQRQRAMDRESKRHTLRTSYLLERVQDVLSYVQVHSTSHGEVKQGADASPPDLQNLNLRRTVAEGQVASRVCNPRRRETLRLLNSRMEGLEKSGEKMSDIRTKPSCFGDVYKDGEIKAGEDTLSDKENDSLTPERPLVAKSRNTSFRCSVESCDSPLASLSLCASLMGSYAQLPGPLPSCNPVTRRLRKPGLAPSSNILISVPITDLELSKTMPVQSESHASDYPPTGKEWNCSCPEFDSQALSLARKSSPSSSITISPKGPVTDPHIPTHTPSPNPPGPTTLRETSLLGHFSPFQRSLQAPLNQSYDVDSPAPNILRPHIGSGSRSFTAPLHCRLEFIGRSQHSSEDQKTQRHKTNTLQDRDQQKAVCYLTAIARGFLTRRLLQTEKIKHLRKTIQDSKELNRCFQADAQQRRASFTLQDLSLQHRVRAQLRAALCKVHEIFFVWPLRSRLALLQQDRELRNTRRHRETEKTKGPLDQQGLSSATQKSLERKRQRLGIKIPLKPKNSTTSVLQSTQRQDVFIDSQKVKHRRMVRKTSLAHPLLD